MKRYLALMLAAVMLLSASACGKAAASGSDPAEPASQALSASEPEQTPEQASAEEASAAPAEPAEAPSAEPAGPVSGDLADCHVVILSAEDFTAADGKPGVRFYYDFTNNSDQPVSSFFTLRATASQDGAELVGTFTMEDVPEYSYASLEIMPGLTIRCVAEYAYDPAGGPLEFKLTDFWEDGELTAVFDPQALPGRPDGESVIEPIPDPDWTDGLSPQGSLGDVEVSIARSEVSEDWAGNPMIRIYYELTNRSDTPQTFFASVFYTVMQDGVALESTFTNGDVPEDANDMVDVEPGETITVAKCYILRSGSPVTVVLTDIFSQYTLGTVLPAT